MEYPNHMWLEQQSEVALENAVDQAAFSPVSAITVTKILHVYDGDSCLRMAGTNNWLIYKSRNVQASDLNEARRHTRAATSGLQPNMQCMPCFDARFYAEGESPPASTAPSEASSPQRSSQGQKV